MFLTAMSGSGIALVDQASSSQGITTTRIALWALAHAAIVEELALRGIFQPAIEEACGIVVALVATTLTFVLMHAGNGNFAVQWSFYALVSAVTGYLGWRSKSVGLPIAAHVVLNLGINGVVALHGPIPGSVLRDYTIQLSAATLLAGVLFAMCVVLDRLRTRSS
jgi:membrane protease YdiL (CAAX protease family)